MATVFETVPLLEKYADYYKGINPIQLVSIEDALSLKEILHQVGVELTNLRAVPKGGLSSGGEDQLDIHILQAEGFPVNWGLDLYGDFAGVSNNLALLVRLGKSFYPNGDGDVRFNHQGVAQFLRNNGINPADHFYSLSGVQNYLNNVLRA